MSSVNIDVQIQTKFCHNGCSLRRKYTVGTMISPVQLKYVSANEAVYLTFPPWVTEPDVRHCEYEVQVVWGAPEQGPLGIFRGLDQLGRRSDWVYPTIIP